MNALMLKSILEHWSFWQEHQLIAVMAAGWVLGRWEPQGICSCLAIEPDIADYRHLAKHLPIPNITAQVITVDVGTVSMQRVGRLRMTQVRSLSSHLTSSLWGSPRRNSF